MTPLPAVRAPFISAVLRAAAGAVVALAGTRALGAPALPVEGALEQLAELHGHLFDPTTPPPFIVTYIEYTPRKKRRSRVRPDWDEPVDDSDWDPDPVNEQIYVSRCRALLLEVVRRAIHDWILYRTHKELTKKQIAHHAHTWLFEEKPGHAWWKLRHDRRQGQMLTSFINICELLDLDPEYVRRRAKRMTPKQIMTAGRPAESRHKPAEEVTVVEYELTESIDLDGLDESPEEQYPSLYAAQFAVRTPGYL